MAKINHVKGGQGTTPDGKRPGNKNLISLADRTPEDRRRISALGGAASAKTRSLVMKLNHLAKKGMTDETAKKLYELMTDENLSSLDILMYLSKTKGKLKNTDEQMKMSKLLLDWHKSRHGEKNQKQQIEHFGSQGIIIEFKEPGEREVKVIGTEVHDIHSTDNQTGGLLEEAEGQDD